MQQAREIARQLRSQEKEATLCNFSPAVSCETSDVEEDKVEDEVTGAFYPTGLELEVSFLHIESLVIEYPEEWETETSEGIRSPSVVDISSSTSG